MPTPNLGLVEPVIGSQNWGGDMNHNLSVIDLACGLLGVNGPGNPTLGNVLIGNGSNFVSGVLAANQLSNGVIGSGAVVLATNPTLAGVVITGTATLPIATLSGKITNYNSITTVDNGVPSEIAHDDRTNQSAAVGPITIYTPAASGMFRIAWSAAVTQADGGSSTLGGNAGFQAVYTSPTDSVVKTTAVNSSDTSTANTTGTAVGGDKVVYAEVGTPIWYQFGYTAADGGSPPTAMVYELHVKVEAL